MQEGADRDGPREAPEEEAALPDAGAAASGGGGGGGDGAEGPPSPAAAPATALDGGRNHTTRRSVPGTHTRSSPRTQG